MLEARNRGKRKTRRALVLLIGAVILVADMIWAARAHLEHRRYAQELARKAAQTAATREAESAASLEKARQEMPSDAPIPRDWTIQRVDKALDPQRNTDLALLTKLARALLARDPAVRRGNYELMKTFAVQAVSSGSTTEFERVIAEHADSESAVLHAAHGYIVALRPLQEAEQALALGLFQPGTQKEPSALPPLLSDLVALRALGELQAEEPRKAMESTLHAYQFLQAVNDPQRLVHAFPFYANRCREIDWLFERSLDALWTKEPLGQDDQERAISIIGWRPSKEEVLEALYACATPAPVDATPLAILKHPLDSLARRIRTHGTYELIAKLEPVMADDQHSGADISLGQDNEDGIPKWAYATRQIRRDAWLLDKAWHERAARAALARAVFAMKDYRGSHRDYPEQPGVSVAPKGLEGYGYARTERGFVVTRQSPGLTGSAVWDAKE